MSSIDNNALKFLLSEEEHEKIFQEEIIPKIFTSVESSFSPTVVIFGGQPGAGKSTAVDAAAKDLKSQGGSALITGDELRDHHPAYAPLLVQDDKTAAFYTDKDTGHWIEKAIEHAKKLTCNIVIEGTMRVPEKVAETMLLLRKAGYQIDARALAVNERLSWQGVLQRYERQHAIRGYGRMTTPESHQAGYVGMLNTIEKIEQEKLADKMTLYKRGEVILYENELKDGKWQNNFSATAALEEERNRFWNQNELIEYIAEFDKLIEALQKPERQASPDEILNIEMLRQKAYQDLTLKYKEQSILSPEIQKQILNAKPVTQSNTVYHGKFIHVDNNYLYQELGRNNVIKHSKSVFPPSQLPEVGKFMSIKYENGQVQMILKSTNKNLDLSR